MGFRSRGLPVERFWLIGKDETYLFLDTDKFAGKRFVWLNSAVVIGSPITMPVRSLNAFADSTISG